MDLVNQRWLVTSRVQVQTEWVTGRGFPPISIWDVFLTSLPFFPSRFQNYERASLKDRICVPMPVIHSDRYVDDKFVSKISKMLTYECNTLRNVAKKAICAGNWAEVLLKRPFCRACQWKLCGPPLSKVYKMLQNKTSSRPKFTSKIFIPVA